MSSCCGNSVSENYKRLHDSSHPNADELDKLYKNVEVCYENYCDCSVAYAKGIGVCSSAVNSYFKALENYYKTYKKACTKEEEPSKDSTGTTETSDSSDIIGIIRVTKIKLGDY